MSFQYQSEGLGWLRSCMQNCGIADYKTHNRKPDSINQLNIDMYAHMQADLSMTVNP